MKQNFNEHYTSLEIEPIEIIKKDLSNEQYIGYLKGNIIKYTLRTIHDSFGTSLGEAEDLKRVIRGQLFKVYTEYKPLEMFKQYVEDQLGHTVEVEEPLKGTLDLTNILKSTYVFH